MADILNQNQYFLSVYKYIGSSVCTLGVYMYIITYDPWKAVIFRFLLWLIITMKYIHIVHCGAFCSMRLYIASHTIDIHIMPLLQYIDSVHCCILSRNARRTMAFHLFINLFTFTQRLNTFFVFALIFFYNFHCSSFMYHGHHGIILITVEMLFSVYIVCQSLYCSLQEYTYKYKFYCVTDYDISRI